MNKIIWFSKAGFALTIVTFFCVGFVTPFNSALAAVDCEKEESFPLISKEELKKAVAPDAKEKPLVVDVNSESSFKEAHVDGAIHFGSKKKEFEKLLPKNKDALIVAYCGGPMCTAWHKAAEIACKLGYTNVKHFKDGISGWKKN